jgi:hypothetical protein
MRATVMYAAGDVRVENVRRTERSSAATKMNDREAIKVLVEL